MDDQDVQQILANWLNFGSNVDTTTSLPRHPEFIYRKSGNWKGWNHFLQLTPSSPLYAHNARIDQIETEAWNLYIKRYHS
ncbi:hypothetical protein RGL50_004169 [Vibrio alginolyticus]|nr:hypothetical protein [Vibrio alginolyticus]